jgi:hypothetical protein
MMATIFIFFCGAAVFHFVYDGIIAPSRRMSLRYEVFAQRDRLREAKEVHDEEIDCEVFESLHDYLNGALGLVSTISVIGLIQATRSLKTEPEVQAAVNQRRAILARCPVVEVREIQDRATIAVSRALLVNSLGLILWLLPFAIVFVCLGWIADAIQRLLLTPARELRRYFPDPMSWAA